MSLANESDAERRSGELVGRDAETRALRSLVVEAFAGIGRSLVVVGEAGIGKSRLVDDAVDAAAGARAVRACGSEPEQQMSYAGLHRLLRPLADEVARLPEPQRAALQITFGERVGPAPSRFLVALATLTALGAASRSAPVLCVVDDAHWLDPESLDALAFVARRLERERIAIVLVTRDDDATLAALAGLDQLLLRGLTTAAATAMLADRIPGRMHPAVVDRIVEHSNGNPLELLDLARSLSAQQRAGTAALPDPLPLVSGIQDYFLRSVAALPAAAQEFVLVAACGSADDAQTVWRAAHSLGITPQDADAAAVADICSVTDGVRFSHPLVRSAIYGAARPQDRRAAHAALAHATASTQPDRRAWHLAQGASAPDEAVAAELELSADRARARGGHAAQAMFLRRSAELTTDSTIALRRTLDAADAYVLCGDFETAGVLVARAAESSTGHQRARGRLIGAVIDIARAQPAYAAAALLHAVADAEPADTEFIRVCLCEGLLAAILAGRYLSGTTQRAVAAATLSMTARRPGAEAVDQLFDAFAARVGTGYGDAVRPMREAVDALSLDAGYLGRNTVGAVLLAMMACDELWDEDARRALFGGLEVRLRHEGALVDLSLTLSSGAAGLVREGRFAEASNLYGESQELSAAYGLRSGVPWILLYAWQGRGEQTRELADVMLGQQSLGLWTSFARQCLAILALGQQDYASARDLLLEIFDEDTPGFSSITLPDLVEAAARSGDDALARRALDRLTDRATAAATPLAAGLLLRSRALLAPDDEAEELFTAALDLLRPTQVATDIARGHLLYGEWLRRSGRRSDARVQLRHAHEMFSSMGAGAFAERARSALLATGARATASVRAPDDRGLTPQEERIAGLAVRGLTNSEIASSLFVTSSTVEFHMTKILRKAGATSRRELAGLLEAPAR